MLLHTGAVAVTVVVIREAMEAALGVVMVAVHGVATVTLPGVDMVTDFTATVVFLVRVLDSSATVTLGTAIPITLIPPRTMATLTMTAGTMATRITVVSTTKGLI